MFLFVSDIVGFAWVNGRPDFSQTPWRRLIFFGGISIFLFSLLLRPCRSFLVFFMFVHSVFLYFQVSADSVKGSQQVEGLSFILYVFVVIHIAQDDSK